MILWIFMALFFLHVRFDVSGYPTIKFFKKGEAYDYDDARTTEGTCRIIWEFQLKDRLALEFDNYNALCWIELWYDSLVSENLILVMSLKLVNLVIFILIFYFLSSNYFNYKLL